MKNVKAFIRIAKMTYAILDKNQRKAAVVVFFSITVCSILDMVSVSVLYPFLEAVTYSEEQLHNSKLSILYRINPNFSVEQIIVISSVIIAFVFIFKNLIAIVCTKMQFRFASNFRRDTSTFMLDTYMHQAYEFFVNTNSSIIIRGVEQDVEWVYEVLMSLFRIFNEVLVVLFIGIYLIASDWMIALLSLGSMFVCFLAVTLLFKNASKRAGNTYRTSYSENYKNCMQAIYSAKEIMVMDRRRFFVDKYKKSVTKLARAYESKGVIHACPERIIEGLCMSSFIAVICLRVLIGIDSNSFIPIMGVFAMGAFKLLPLISKMSSEINNIVFNQEGVFNCYNNFFLAKQMTECGYLYDRNSEENKKEINSSRYWEKVLINNISWKYSNSEKYVLQDCSLEICKGDVIGIIGASGSGKTTLADIVLGLFMPQKGEVMIDGVDIFSHSKEWSELIGYIPQTVYLLDDTVRANVAFGISDKEIDDEKVVESLRKAQLLEFVSSLPEGINTFVGERGIKFSGGQRQRIAIARSLYQDPEILVFDEATSALDNETEKSILESIDALKGQKTMLIIAHRLTTIRNCNKVFEIVNGKAISKLS